MCMCAECICVHVCSRCMEARWGLWKSSLSFSALSLWFSSWTWSLWFSGRLTTSRLQWSSSLCLSSGGVIGTWDHVGLVTWVLGLELWSWKLRSRLLTVEPPNIFFSVEQIPALGSVKFSLLAREGKDSKVIMLKTAETLFRNVFSTSCYMI